MKKQDETNEKKSDSRKIIRRVTTVILIVILILLLTRCQACGNVNIPSEPTDTTETTAVTEETTCAAEETEAAENEETTEATHGEETEATKATEKPHKHDYTIKEKVEPGCFQDGYTVYCCSCGDTFTKTAVARGYHDWTEWETVEAATTESEGLMRRSCKDCETTETKTIGKLTAQSKPTESTPVETTPAETKPAETQPSTEETRETAATEPTACQHSWQTVDHPEEGHDECYVVCDCGYKCKTTAEWIAHTKNYEVREALLNHGGNGSMQEYIVDSPAYTEWVCSKCGAVTTTQP